MTELELVLTQDHESSSICLRLMKLDVCHVKEFFLQFSILICVIVHEMSLNICVPK